MDTSTHDLPSVLSDPDVLCIYRNRTTSYVISMNVEIDLDMREGADPLSSSSVAAVAG
jgi:hypothetical protein